MRLRRSALIVPGDDDVLLGKAARSEADVCIIDWEDGVLDARKTLAREITRAALTATDWSDHEVFVRINAPTSEYWETDVAAAANLPIDGIRLSKISGVDYVRRVADLLEVAETNTAEDVQSPLLIWASIESVQSLISVLEIASCSPRVTALNVGGGDLGADLQVKRLRLSSDRQFGPVWHEYLYAQSKVIVAARANGLDAQCTAYTDYKDLNGLREYCEYCAQLGFNGCLAVSPRQLGVINEVFGPSADDIAWAEAHLSEFEISTTQRQKTVMVVRGQFADAVQIRNARRIMELQAAIEQRSEQRKAKREN
jgi:citrate lyase beta subunit